MTTYWDLILWGDFEVVDITFPCISRSGPQSRYITPGLAEAWSASQAFMASIAGVKVPGQIYIVSGWKPDPLGRIPSIRIWVSGSLSCKSSMVKPNLYNSGTISGQEGINTSNGMRWFWQWDDGNLECAGKQSYWHAIKFVYWGLHMSGDILIFCILKASCSNFKNYISADNIKSS